VIVQKSTMIAMLLAPLVGGTIWWLFFRFAKIAHDFLWKRLPEGRLRRLLLKKVS